MLTHPLWPPSSLPSRSIHRSQTAPEGLPDTLLVAALAPGHGFADSSPASSTTGSDVGSSFGAAASKTVPSKRPLHAVQVPGGTPADSGESPGSTASFNTASSASLLSGSALPGPDGLAGPVTPAAAVAAAARRRRHQQAAVTAAQLLQARSCSYKDLFDAQVGGVGVGGWGGVPGGVGGGDEKAASGTSLSSIWRAGDARCLPRYLPAATPPSLVAWLSTAVTHLAWLLTHPAA